MTYDTFINKVTSLLLYDSIEDDAQHSAFIDQHARTWMSTMQYYVENFKVKNVNAYREADVTIQCDGATITLPSTLENLTRIEFVKPDNYPRTIIVSDAGTADANGTYTREDGSSIDQRPTYTKGEYFIQWDGEKWELSVRGAAFAISDGVADKLINADLTTAGAISEITFMGRAATGTVFTFGLCPDAMTVEGAGTAAANGVYLRDGVFATRPAYAKPDGSYELKCAAGATSGWYILRTVEGSLNFYQSNSNVATPDLAGPWELGGSLSPTPEAPAPTVRRSTWADIDAAGIDHADVTLLTVTSTQVGNNAWEQHTIAVANVTADDFYASTTVAAGWSDVNVTAATHSPRYQLDESASGSLDGVTAIDSSGNGYDGEHIGGTGGFSTALAAKNFTQILYDSTNDVVSPDLVTAWTADAGDAPVPAVTKGNSCDEVIPMSPTNYDERDELLNPGCKYQGCYKYAIDRRATEITFYPYPQEDYYFGPESIRITWEGVKNDYNGSDEIPFTEDTVKNCSDYLNAHLARKKEDKLSNYNSFYQSYLEGRKEIALAQRAKSWQRA